MKYLILLSILCSAINCYPDTLQSEEYNGPDGTVGGYDYVDLGLPNGTLWATYNIGATHPYEVGDYFAWGEVEPRIEFTWKNYEFFQGFEYDPKIGQRPIVEDIGENISGTEYDAARYQWGNGWRLPDETDCQELWTHCWSKATFEHGAPGVRVFGPNGHSIFIPALTFGYPFIEEDPYYACTGIYLTGNEHPEIFDGKPVEPSGSVRSLVVKFQTILHAGQTPKSSGVNIRAVVTPGDTGIGNVISGNPKTTLEYRDGVLYIKGGSNRSGVVNVYDLSGRLIFVHPITREICQLPELSHGVYVVSYNINGNRVLTQKINVK